MFARREQQELSNTERPTEKPGSSPHRFGELGRKRLLFVEQNRDGTVGGSHLQLLALVKGLDRSLFEPVVAFYERHALWEQFRAYGPVVLLPSHHPVRFGAGHRGLGRVAAVATRKAVNLTRASAATLGRMALVAAQVRPHLIHMNNCARTGAEWPMVARLCGAWCVVHQRGYAAARYANLFDRIICVSRYVEARLHAAAPALMTNTVQIYDGIDVDDLRQRAGAGNTVALRQALGVKEGESLIGLVGNILAWKGQDVLMQALPFLSSHKPWRCFFIGGVPRSEDSQSFSRRLHELARTHAVQDRVVFTGYRPDVPALMSLLDVVVHTSVEPDPLPNVVLEAMALGKPVIATNHGGPAEEIEHGRSGFLVPPGDVRALAACLDRLLASPGLCARVGAEALVRVEARFSVAQCVARVQEVYLSFWPELRRQAWQPGVHPQPDAQ